MRLRLDVTANWVSHPCLVLSEAKSRKRHCCGLIISPACSLQLVSPFIELKNGHKPSSFIAPLQVPGLHCPLGEAVQVHAAQKVSKRPLRQAEGLWRAERASAPGTCFISFLPSHSPVRPGQRGGTLGSLHLAAEPPGCSGAFLPCKHACIYSTYLDVYLCTRLSCLQLLAAQKQVVPSTEHPGW